MIQRSIIGILSLLIVFFATCGNTSTSYLDESEIVASSEKLPIDEQDDQEENPATFKLMAYEAVLPLLQANFLPLQYTVFKISVKPENIIEEERQFPLPYISYFNTLFRLIISPNAP